jgi:eukaryotic-like serine/threonine-protein kinase
MSRPDQPEAAIVEAALKLSPQDRAAYLDRACGGDEHLRRKIIERLFAANQTTSSLSQPPPAVPPQATFIIPTAPEPPGEKPGTCIGHYKLLELRGEGGMGTVWVAEQTEPVRRKVALKIIKLGMDTKQVVARFQAERQALALMDHPNIAKVFDAGATGTGRPYFVMEFVTGEPITSYCDRHNLSTRERLHLFVQVCAAIEHAHQKGIIHRDIKPSNILITLQDGMPVPKVIDFGIAKATAGRLTDMTIHTALAEFIGTPAYMSPEQAEMTGVDVDARTDIYSLGVLLYELLTGKTPFDAKRFVQAGLDAIRRIIREEEPLRPSTRLSALDAKEQTTVAKCRQANPPRLIHQVHGDLDWIVMKTLEKDRTRRYETAKGLAMDINRLLNNEPILARSPSYFYRLQKLVRRNRLLFSAIGAAGAVVLIAISISVWQAGRYGNIELLSEPPGAAIYEGDQMLGTTPYRANNVRSGKLEYRLQLAGYEPYLLPIYLGAKATTKWTAQLRKRGSPDSPPAEIRILDLQGTVEVMPAGATAWVLATTNLVLHAGDSLRTGQNSTLLLLWSDRSRVRIGELTTMEVSAFGKGPTIRTRAAVAHIRG